MKIRLIPFRPEHYVDVFTSTVQFSTAVGLPDPVKTACALAEDGLGATGIAEDGSLAGCAGIILPWAGYGIGWAMVHRAVLAWPIGDRTAVYHAIRQQFDRWIADHELRRVEANVQPDLPIAARFVRALGFHKESDMPQYRNGQTFAKWVRLA